MSRYEIRKILFQTVVFLAVTALSVAANDAVRAKIASLVHNGSVVLYNEQSETLLSINPDQPFVPASILKIVTSHIALDLLGATFRFETECYIGNDSSLIIKGGGDPFLVSDEIRLLAAALKSKGLKKVRKLCLDHSAFSDDVSVPGISKTNNPYDALNGALVVNFNTINVGKDRSGKIYSAEGETPLTLLAVERASPFTPGKEERINLSAKQADCRRYAAELLYAIFIEQGITINDSSVGETVVPDSLRPFLVYKNSRPLDEVLRGLLQYSNNFIANQIFLAVGAKKFGFPATMEKGTRIFEAYLRSAMKIPESGLTMVEGSGISRSNHVTGNVMISILEMFRPHVDLLTPKNGHPVKSGTLYGVSNYAGYIKTDAGLRPFVILLNQKKNNRDAILELLAHIE